MCYSRDDNKLTFRCHGQGVQSQFFKVLLQVTICDSNDKHRYVMNYKINAM